ncbi:MULTISPECIES: P1 family peptidase [unclassified Halanaerobium]|uniref:P1 family peptidase n=1 Tax=unclassified Halanaerobium TaxID=2641197 RepID=UPI000DF3E51C|nr:MULTISPECIES: P1 family peptidase [unclassified Halanaerobium]RCW50665.1 L-aminopeptidase/D-esterase-like protein [Halanaerobium sp. MA284_MarDTE_T2]RCW86833.1 L-aminopeptidase/D-esterase-like protein [Halanaerobium sp. DL-01]
MNNDITAVDGIKVGNAENIEGGTGCTVIICGNNFSAGAEVRGGAPGTRESALLASEAVIQNINAVLLTGGSAFGLDAAAGVMDYLEEQGTGFQTGSGYVPIVPAAVIYDLEYKSSKIRPDKKMAYQACRNADNSPLENKSIGAAAGATCGKINGMKYAHKTKLGHAAIKIGKLIVAALVVVNAFGDIKDYKTGKIAAGAKDENGNFIDTESIFLNKPELNTGLKRENTTLAVIATNARLNKSEANRVSIMAQDGLARTIYPVHTMLDGDTVFTLASNKINADINQVGTAAAAVAAEAVCSSV